MRPPLIRLENVDVALDGTTVLRRINWRLRAGEHWAILGGNGSGKSTLLKLIRGELWPAPGQGRRVYAFDGDEQTTAVGIKEKIALVSPELQARYLQQDWQLTGWQVVQSGFQGGDYVYQRPHMRQLAAARSVVRMLGIEKLIPRNVQELSTGELRKILIARALAGSPRVLVCDEICDGLDATAHAALLRLLEKVARNGTQLLYTTHWAEEILPSMTHRLMLDRGRIVKQGEANNAPAGIAACPLAELRPGPRGFELRRHPAAVASGGDGTGAGGALPHPKTLARPSAPGSNPSCPTRLLIGIKRANVYLGFKRVLRDIELEIRAGQHWAILGPNGAGKSTLLKLILGDLHPALGGRVRRFEFTAGNTIWEWKRKMGFVSPELQSNYHASMTGAEVITSGFSSTVGLKPRTSRDQKQRVAGLIAELRLGALASKSILQMSYGEFRRILLARALVHGPELLVGDEPFDGLDAVSRAAFSRTLERVARQDTSLVMVTHHLTDLPACITHVGELTAGRLTFAGKLVDYRARHGRAAAKSFDTHPRIP